MVLNSCCSHSGPSHMSLYLRPHAEAFLTGWSFSGEMVPQIGRGFIFYTHGLNAISWTFWIEIWVSLNSRTTYLTWGAPQCLLCFLVFRCSSPQRSLLMRAWSLWSSPLIIYLVQTAVRSRSSRSWRDSQPGCSHPHGSARTTCTDTEGHTNTHSHTGFLFYEDIPQVFGVFLLYKVYFLSSYPNPRPKPTPYTKLPDFQSTSLCDILACFLMVLFPNGFVSKNVPTRLKFNGRNILVRTFDPHNLVNTRHTHELETHKHRMSSFIHIKLLTVFCFIIIIYLAHISKQNQKSKIQLQMKMKWSLL